MVYIDIVLFGEVGRYRNELDFINKIKTENKSEIFKINLQNPTNYPQSL